MTAEQTASDKLIMRRCIGYMLIGFGFPSALCGFTLIRMVFLSKHGHAMAAFRPNHPAFVVAAILLAIGLLLLGGGGWMLRAAKRAA